MYVLIIARGYPTNKYKMNGIFEFDQAKALAKNGCKVVYAAIDIRSIRRWRRWGIEIKNIEGVKVFAINIPCGRIPKTVLNKIKVWALKKIYKIIEKSEGEPDVIHSHFIEIGSTASQVFGNSKIPLILTEHFSGMNQKHLSSYYYKLGKLTYPHMDKVIAVSKYLAENLHSKFNVDVVVLPNMLDLENFRLVNNRDFKKRKKFIFVSVGRLHPDKRMDLLIRSFYNAFKCDKHVLLYIYGEGSERNKLEMLIKSLGLNNQVFLMGLVDREDIAKKMSNSDAFVLASKLETFGVAYIEALATGLPVVSTKCGGPEEFINKGNGILVPTDDLVSLENALKKIYYNIDYYDKHEISKSIVNRFSGKIISHKLITVYEAIIKNKDSKADIT